MPWAIAALSAALLSLTLWVYAARAPGLPPARSIDVLAPSPEEAATAPPPAPSQRSPVPALTAAPAPPGCADDLEDDPPGLVRPSIWDLLRISTDELRDRLPELSRGASPALREGLEGMRSDPERAADRLLSAPDRDRDGFDVAIAGLLHMGMIALADDPALAARLARRAEGARPSLPEPPALLALAAGDDAATSREALRRAVALAPDEPALLLAGARAENAAGEFSAAQALAARYLPLVPEDARTASWRGRLEARAALLRGHFVRREAGISVRFPEGVSPSRADAILEQTRQALNEMARLLERGRRSELAIAVYRDREEMRRATCAPSWSGGVFDGVLHLDAETVTRADPSWSRVVRHEATHAQLALVHGRVPHWLNEGLAQRAEGEPSASTRAAWARLAARGGIIPFASLEGQLIVIDDPDDARLAYHQSYAMVRFLIAQRGPRAIRDAIDEVEAQRPEDLLSRLVAADVGPAFRRFLSER